MAKLAQEYRDDVSKVDLTSVLELPLQERLDLVEAIWDSVASDSKNLKLEPWQAAELDRRIAEFEADPTEGMSWHEVQQRVTGSR